MMNRLASCVALALGLLFWVPATPTLAQSCDPSNRDCVLQLVDLGTILPLGELVVVSGVMERGEILDAQVFERNGNWFYAFRVLDTANNNVLPIIIDATTGGVVSGLR